MEYLIILVVCLVVYFQTLKYGFVVDDITTHKGIEKEDQVRCRRFFIDIFTGSKPIQNSIGDHALTILLHFIVCSLIYLYFNNLPAALLFSVAVSNNQVSVWLNGKRYAVNTILCLLALIFPFSSVPLWLLTAFYQASAVTFPIVLALKIHWSFIFLIPLILLIGRKRLIRCAKSRIQKNGFEKLTKWEWRKLILICKTFSLYFVRGILPYTPSMYIKDLKMVYLEEKDTINAFKIDARFFAGLLLVICIPFTYFIDKQIWFALMWWLITVSVFSNWVTITMFFAERYMYLPNVGLMVALSIFLNYIHPYAWLVIFGLYTGRLISYLPMYKDIKSFLEHHAYTDPTNDCGWEGLIRLATASKNTPLGLHYTERALLNGGESTRIWIARAAFFGALKHKNEALECLNKADSMCNGEVKRFLTPKIDEMRKQLK